MENNQWTEITFHYKGKWEYHYAKNFGVYTISYNQIYRKSFKTEKESKDYVDENSKEKK